MAKLEYYDILLKPLMTEKSMRFMELGLGDDDKEKRLKDGKDPGTDKNMSPAYSFYVHPAATKTQVKDAVEKLFAGTKVERVNTMTVQPKKRHRRGFAPGATVKRKKAIVTLAPGSKEIEVFQGI
jgi:large subunit ribosomal protein L23